MLEMMLVGGLAFHPRWPPGHVEQARVPIAPFGLALRSPMRPDPELGVAKPLRNAIVAGEGLPARGDRTRSPRGTAKSRRGNRSRAAAGKDLTAREERAFH